MAKGCRNKSEKIRKTKRSIDDEKKEKNLKRKKINKSTPKFYIPKKKEYSVKKKLIPLKDLNIKPKKNIKEMNIEEIKEFASLFDLNPAINYILLNYLKNNSKSDYHFFIKKYKFTLDFDDAFNLGCFEEKEIISIQKEFSYNINQFNLKLNDKNINSLSRKKLFNLFFYILNQNNQNNNKLIDIYKKISSYSIPITLIFKVPNRFGNIELNYYTYLTFFINFFISEIRKYEYQEAKNKENKDNEDGLYEEVYFNWDASIRGIEQKFDVTEINERRKRFDTFIKENYKEVQNKSSKITIKSGKAKNRDVLLKTMLDKIMSFQIFKKKIIEMLSESDESILSKIKFIFHCLLFPSTGVVDMLSLYSNCLRTKPYTEDEINSQNFIYQCNLVDENCKSNKYQLFAIENIDNKFSRSLESPFYYNSKYYSFPTLLTKNIIDNNQEIRNSFINYLKYIYSSNIIKDIFYLTPEFEEFIYPLEDEKIFDELMEYTIFMPLNGYDLHGYTQKEIPEVLISVMLDEAFPDESHISKIICELSQILNTCLHEQLKHYIKSLIFYNSFRFNLKKRIDSDLDNYDKDDKYIKGILSIMKNKNKYDEIDGGHKAEIFLYGGILDKVFFPQALELFKKSNWNKEIYEHLKCFNNANKNIKNTYQTFYLNEIYLNNDFCEFFRLFIKIFIETIGDKITNSITFDNNASSRRPGYFRNNENKNTITFDYNCYINIKRNYIKDSSL